MGILKVSVFQKSLSEGLNLSLYKRLAALKSDFLVLPQYFFADSSVQDLHAAAEKSQQALDWLLKLTDSYRGIVIGGSLIHQEEDVMYSATPVIAHGELIDWYRKRNLSETEAAVARAGSEAGIFILAGQRFAVLSGKDVENQEHFQELADQGIKLIFLVDSCPQGKNGDGTVEKNIGEAASSLGLYITRCCATGSMFGTALRGRSMVVTPSGISWRIAPSEEDQEILKTIVLSVHEAK